MIQTTTRNPDVTVRTQFPSLSSIRPLRPSTVAALAGLVWLLIAAGCSTYHTGAESFATVTIRNHTPVHMPEPVHKFRMDVRQQPGYSYPAPPTRMHIREQNIHPPLRYGQTIHDAHECVR